jgi:4-hydroxybenzoate polyprenyltransferase/phosphoserine phosphatase
MAEPASATQDHREPPLVVDLDGTLLLTDVLHESSVRLLRNRPLQVLALPLQLRAGKAPLKQFIAERVDVQVETLPYNEALLAWLREQRGKGRQLVLCTASNDKFARQVAAHLGIFEEVMASDARDNLGGEQKAAALVQRFGRGGFDYAGNARADLPIWAGARRAIVVSNDQSLVSAVQAVEEVTCAFAPTPPRADEWRSSLRLQQWLKNLLLFAPALAAHQVGDAGALAQLLLAFLAFGLCASGTYIINDLLDLESDRLHPRKRQRPLASGRITIFDGILAALALLAAGLGLAALTSGPFLLCVLFYLLLTGSYSWWLKRLVLLDCITLSMLYTLRIVAGAAALQMGLSFWLLAFSVFLFLSLAFVKRYAEIEVQVLAGREELHGRGYRTSDAPLVQTLGIAAGFAAALVFSLYLNSEQILLLYATPEIVWGAVVVLVYWISWMWLQAHRGQMHDDPLVFAIKDPASLVAGAVFLLVLFLGTVHWSW